MLMLRVLCAEGGGVPTFYSVRATVLIDLGRIDEENLSRDLRRREEAP
jgi:hypothetical protein